MLPEELKLKAMGLFQIGKSGHEVASELGVAYPTVLKWRKDYRDGEKAEILDKVVKATPIIVHRIANEVREEIVNIGREFLPQVGDFIGDEEVDVETELEVLTGDLISGVDGYQELSTKLQQSAVKIIDRLDSITEVTNGPIELGMLVESLTKLQLAFFNKNVTNVNVLNAPGAAGSNQQFGGFKNRD